MPRPGWCAKGHPQGCPRAPAAEAKRRDKQMPPATPWTKKGPDRLSGPNAPCGLRECLPISVAAGQEQIALGPREIVARRAVFTLVFHVTLMDFPEIAVFPFVVVTLAADAIEVTVQVP